MQKKYNLNLKELKKAFEAMSTEDSVSNRAILGLNLVREAEFMKSTLNKLKKEITSKGVVTEMDQGKYTIDRGNPALSQYNQLVKNYQSCIKAINDNIEMFNIKENSFVLQKDYKDNIDIRRC